jgi:hypothetical protein
MKTQIPNNSKLKLHEFNNKKMEEIHLNELGLKIPDNYFAHSKNEILKELLKEKKKVIPFYQQKKAWLIAASLLLLFGLIFFNVFSILESDNNRIVTTDTINQMNKELNEDIASTTFVQSQSDDIISNDKINDNQNTQASYIKQIENDVLVKSLFIDDNEINEYVTNYMLEDI